MNNEKRRERMVLSKNWNGKKEKEKNQKNYCWISKLNK